MQNLAKIIKENGTPNISDIIQSKRKLRPDQIKELIRLDDCIIQRYRQAKVSAKECNHPLVKSNGIAYVRHGSNDFPPSRTELDQMYEKDRLRMGIYG